MIKEITSKENPKIKNLAKLFADKKYRKKQGLFVCEGLVNLKEADKSNITIKELYFTAEHEENIKDIKALEKYVVLPKIIESVSDVKTPQGIIFVCEIPLAKGFTPGGILALDEVRDSGNIGTIIRTAEGFGITNIALLGNCVEIYNPKTVRATMGSIFRIVPLKTDIENLREYANEHKMQIFATALSSKSVDIREVDLKNAIAVIGNEAKGVSDEVLKMADEHIIIPIKTAESFNASVAGAIVLWEMSR